MMNCFERIIGINNPCDTNTASVSGLFVSDALNFSWQTADKLLNNGIDVNSNINAVLRKTYSKVDGDISVALNANGWNLGGNIVGDAWSGVLQSGAITPAVAANTFVGIVFNQKTYSQLNIIVIEELRIYLTAPAATVTLKVVDAGVEKTYTLSGSFIAGENVINCLDAFGANLKLQAKPSQKGKLLIDSNLPLANVLNCCNCSGSATNGRPRCTCSTIGSWNGTSETGTQGFGIIAKYRCECSIDALLCEWAKSNKAFAHVILAAFNLLWLQEQAANPPLNYINAVKPTEKMLAEANNDYLNKYNNFISGSKALLKTIDPKCLTCKGIKYYNS